MERKHFMSTTYIQGVSLEGDKMFFVTFYRIIGLENKSETF